jgi:hypothetical protein
METIKEESIPSTEMARKSSAKVFNIRSQSGSVSNTATRNPSLMARRTILNSGLEAKYVLPLIFNEP